MIAVGALHESLTASSAADIWSAGLKQHFSVRQYNKAIQCLTNSTASPPPIEVVLTSCIIFIVFENLCGRNGEALKHLKSGITMLKMWSPKTTSELMVREEYLIPVLTRGYAQHAPIRMPSLFNNLESARKHLQILLDQIYSSIDAAILSEESRDVDAKVLCAKSSLQDWYTKFTKLRHGKDKEEGRSKILLRLQFETALILLAAVQLNDESGFDDHIESFRIIVSQCEELVAVESSLTGNDTTKSEAFTYGFDLNVSLFQSWVGLPQVNRHVWSTNGWRSPHAVSPSYTGPSSDVTIDSPSSQYHRFQVSRSKTSAEGNCAVDGR